MCQKGCPILEVTMAWNEIKSILKSRMPKGLWDLEFVTCESYIGLDRCWASMVPFFLYIYHLGNYNEDFTFLWYFVSSSCRLHFHYRCKSGGKGSQYQYPWVFIQCAQKKRSSNTAGNNGLELIETHFESLECQEAYWSLDFEFAMCQSYIGVDQCWTSILSFQIILVSIMRISFYTSRIWIFEDFFCLQYYLDLYIMKKH